MVRELCKVRLQTADAEEGECPARDVRVSETGDQRLEIGVGPK